MKSKTLKSILFSTFSLLILVSIGYSQNGDTIQAFQYIESVGSQEDWESGWEVILENDGNLNKGETSKENERPEPGFTDFMNPSIEPRPLNLDEIKTKIDYPLVNIDAKENQIDGRVLIRVMIDEEGKYIKHIVISDPHPILTRAVEREISKVRFSPGLFNGKPVKVWVSIPFDFKIIENDPPEKESEKRRRRH